MLAAGLLRTATGRFDVSSSAPVTVYSQGFGFTDAGVLCTDTGAPSGSIYNKGFRMSADGRVYTESIATADIVAHIEGIPINADGAIVTQGSAVAVTVNGNPITSGSALSILD